MYFLISTLDVAKENNRQEKILQRTKYLLHNERYTCITKKRNTRSYNVLQTQKCEDLGLMFYMAVGYNDLHLYKMYNIKMIFGKTNTIL